MKIALYENNVTQVLEKSYLCSSHQGAFHTFHFTKANSIRQGLIKEWMMTCKSLCEYKCNVWRRQIHEECYFWKMVLG